MKEQYENISISLKSLGVPIAILLAGVMIAVAIFFGLKNSDLASSKVGELSRGQVGVLEEDVLPQAPGQQVAPGEGAQEDQRIKTSIDDDAILGNRDSAQVAIVEFSDFECPFCNRFRTQTLVQIKEDYIDTGKAILVYRDLPLSFHNPAAEREAMAAECVREQGGDEVYYQYHDKIFENSPGNGAGLTLESLAGIAEELGFSGVQLKNCIEEEKYKEEVAGDAADAAKAGIRGTPGFVVGKLSQDGSVVGEIISGAQPYSVFKNAIDEQLNQK